MSVIRLVAFATLAVTCACGAEIDGVRVEVGTTARGTGDPCSGCFKVTVTNLGGPVGDVTREPDSAYASWGVTTAVLECNDGSAVDDVSLGTVDLESGVSLEDVALPQVDFESGNLTCKVMVQDGSNDDTIDVTVELP